MYNFSLMQFLLSNSTYLINKINKFLNLILISLPLLTCVSINSDTKWLRSISNTYRKNCLLRSALETDLI